MFIISSEDIGEHETYDMVVDHDDHSFIHSSGVVTHNSGFIITNKPIEEYLPTIDIGGEKCTQYTANYVEKSGAIKFDFLRVNALNDISEALKLVQIASNLEIPKKLIVNEVQVPGNRLLPVNGKFYDIWDLPEDPEVFKDIYEGRTETVFQFSTKGARDWLKFFNGTRPDGSPLLKSVHDMAIFTALDRPGPLDAFVEVDDKNHNMLVEYTRRLQGMKPAETPQIFKDLLKSTQGILVYQESIQELYQQITDCSLTEAEKFRSNVGKKRKAEIEKAYPIFMKSAVAKYGQEEAQKCWDAIQTFSAYGFCIDGDQLIETIDGYKKIEDLEIEDMVAYIDLVDNCKKYANPVNIWCSGEKEIYEVELEDGTTIRASEDHKFLYQNEWVELKSLIFDTQEFMVCKNESVAIVE